MIIDCKYDVVKKVLWFCWRIYLYVLCFFSFYLIVFISEDLFVGLSVSIVNVWDINDGRVGKIVYRMVVI